MKENNFVSEFKNPGGIKEVWLIAYPLIINTSSYTIMQFVDRSMLAWFHPDALAAIIPAGILSFTIIALFMGIAMYSNVFVAQYFGKKKFASMSVSLWQGVFVGFLSTLIILAFTPIGMWILGSTNHAEIVKIMEKQYFLILNLFGGLIVINHALASFFTGQGKTKITMWANVIGNMVNILFAYLMIFGKAGFPVMGIKGAAWSTIFGNVVILIIYLVIIFSEKNRKIFKTSRLFGFYYPAFKRLVKFGVPSGVSFCLDILAFSVFVFLIGNIDKISLAASNILIAIEMLVFMPVLGLAIAGETLVGQYMGRKMPDISAKAAISTFKIAIGYALSIGVLFWLFPNWFVDFFAIGMKNRSADMQMILSTAYPLMKIIALFIVFDVFFIVFGHAIRGAGDTRYHMKWMILCSWLFFVPCAYLISKYAPSVQNMWICGCIYVFLLGLVMTIRFYSNKWRKFDITA
ncbi:MAG: MATE family efflux transporter [Elusimicrobiaceae bacterium]|jgi:multidrug resistance protein, MATE family|nr:MATE family efflux transporter [Elusimicrobiaceae bacterium]MBT3955082.1 MATE family efflux transporter [Elusimicrobiaceae bacterium]MBT4007995.1 MATE family efflux transporter [Elusimicrobiaceae bacterium]MBT4402904.1 MATE family efflux transporter [Elusimicrobiaceae bacterium]MBT4439467.1 MATE family efflux transporter [Elusimicrobiaceae bacterium]